MSPQKLYIATLTAEEHSFLQGPVSRGKAAAHKLLHARILLKGDASEARPKPSPTAPKPHASAAWSIAIPNASLRMCEKATPRVLWRRRSPLAPPSSRPPKVR